MPTKIVLKKTSIPSKVLHTTPISTTNTNNNYKKTVVGQNGQQRNNVYDNHHHSNSNIDNETDHEDDMEDQHRLNNNNNRKNNYLSTPPRSNITDTIISSPPQLRSVISFRSSILRETINDEDEDDNDKNNSNLSTTNNNGNDDNTDYISHQTSNQCRQQQIQKPNTARKVRLSKDDIRASPRITGYLFTMIAASVLLTSVVQFYKTSIDSNNIEIQGGKQFFRTDSGVLVYVWKVYGAIYLSGTGVVLSFLTLIVHFDTVILPKLWFYIFRDGSLFEFYYIMFLILYWIILIHVNTSSLSIGELQANVYFTTWISFGSIVLTLEVWRESAGLLPFASVGLRRLHNQATSLYNDNNNSNNSNHNNNNVNTTTTNNNDNRSSTQSALNTTSGQDNNDDNTNNNDNNDVETSELTKKAQQQQLPLPPKLPTTPTSAAALSTIAAEPIPSTITSTTPVLDKQPSSGDKPSSPDDEPSPFLAMQKPSPLSTSYGKVRRETTSNWIWTAFFSYVFAGSATDIYHNRYYLSLQYENVNDTEKWIIVLSVVWIEAFICFLAILLNETLSSNTSTGNLLPCCHFRRKSGIYRLVFGWRQIEGLVILATGGLKFWIILRYTGVDGVVNGLGNAYFGVWGSFFNSIFTFGTWLRENKNIDYIVHEKTSVSSSSSSSSSIPPVPVPVPVPESSDKEK